MKTETILVLAVVLVGGAFAYRAFMKPAAASSSRPKSGLDIGFNFSKFGN